MNIRLPYGAESLPVDVPDNWINGRCYRAFRFEEAGDRREAMMAALEQPAGFEGSENPLKGRANAVLVVDPAFPAVFDELVPALIEYLERKAGLEPNQIQILLSNDLWDHLEPNAIDSIVPQALLSRHPVELHEPREDGNTREAGTIGDSKIPLRVNTTFLDADLKVLLGPVYPDLLFGFRGGRSMVMPGLMAESTIRELYSYDRVTSPDVKMGEIVNNPFHMLGQQALFTVGCDLLVSPVMTPDGRVAEVFAGAPGAAFIKAVEHVHSKMRVTVKEPMDIVITTGGGAPFDHTFQQVLNAIAAAVPVLKKNGTIVVTAEMSGGFGPSPLGRMLIEAESPSAFARQHSQAKDFTPGQWIAQRYFALLEGHEIILYGKGIDDDLVWAAGMTPTRNVDEAIEVSMQSHGQRCKIVALPDGPFALAALAE